MTPKNFVTYNSGTHQLICNGEWTLTNVATIKKQLEKIVLPSTGELIVNGQSVTKLDTAGAWVINDRIKKFVKKGLKVQLEGFQEHYQELLKQVEKESTEEKSLQKAKSLNWVARLGKNSLDVLDEFCTYLSFVGYLTAEACRVFWKSPRHFRLGAFVNIIDTAGLRALPIIGLLSFLIGVVIAYQMGVQLRNYGANVFIVDLLGLSVLREFGPLITAIMVAGRTGSSFTAQLGTMRVHQEIDVLDTMGVTPAELLVLPRIGGLFIALPLLTMWADIFGIYGGMVMANSMLQVGFHDFLERFQQQVPLRSLIIGLGKAPVFALIIASIGCFQGMQVRGSAESVGKLTTRSVVLSIFFIIVADAAFSVIFSRLKL
ncbi:MAG: ABC transporter permease [Gammaproteobacteria bacterium]